MRHNSQGGVGALNGLAAAGAPIGHFSGLRKRAFTAIDQAEDATGIRAELDTAIAEVEIIGGASV